MHELAICEVLLSQVGELAATHVPARVCRILVQIGPLSGVEPQLLERAFELARAGTCAQHAELALVPAAVRVHCTSCDLTSDAAPNRLVCARCGDWRTQLVGGDELTLMRVELDRERAEEGAQQCVRAAVAT